MVLFACLSALRTSYLSTRALYKSTYLYLTFTSVLYRFWEIQRQITAYTWNLGYSVCSTSLEIAPFDRSHLTSIGVRLLHDPVSYIISETKRDVCWKSRFFISFILDVPVRHSPVGVLPWGLVRDRHQTDGRTDNAQQIRPRFCRDHVAITFLRCRSKCANKVAERR